MRMPPRRLIIALSLLLLLIALAAGGWLAAGIAPSWYTPADAADSAVESASERMEFRVQQELQRIRKDQPRWVLRIPDPIVNDWLATRLGPWLRGQEIDWPDGVGTPQIRCRNGIIEIGVPLDALSGRIGRIDLQPVMSDTDLRLHPAGCGIGRLPIGVPSVWVLGDLTDVPLLGMPVATIIDLIDDRTVHILDIRPTTGHIELDLETQPPSIP